jgi:tRNA(Arg) A34 adenosine deaminase TadA
MLLLDFTTSILLLFIFVYILVLFVKKKEKFDYIINTGLQYNISNNSKRNNLLQNSSIPPKPKMEDIENLKNEMDTWFKENKNKLRPMDKWARISILAALDSVKIGNWGIGNCICYIPSGKEDKPNEWIEILRGGNRFFTINPDDALSTKNVIPQFNSAGHGEMIVLDVFEKNLSEGKYDKTSKNYIFSKDSPIDFRKKSDEFGYGMPDNIVLFTQLNSCQMCLSRIGNAGISRCYWIAPDTAGGLAHKLCDSVPAYFNMLNRQIHEVADTSDKLIEFAFKAFSGPDGAWVNYCTWKLGQLGAPGNLNKDYGYCKGQYFANTPVGQNTMYDLPGFVRTVDDTDGPQIKISVTPYKGVISK